MARNYNPLTDEPYLLQKTLDYRITAWEDGYARVELELSDVHMNRQGWPHGGIYALLIDTAAGHAGSWVPEDQPRIGVMTLSLTTNFISVPKGKCLIAEARKTGGGRNNFFISATLKDELGNLVADGTASLSYRRKKN